MLLPVSQRLTAEMDTPMSVASSWEVMPNRVRSCFVSITLLRFVFITTVYHLINQVVNTLFQAQFEEFLVENIDNAEVVMVCFQLEQAFLTSIGNPALARLPSEKRQVVTLPR